MRSISLLALLVLCGCTPDLPSLNIPEGCQPLLSGDECLLPFPSDFFLVDDAALPSGRRVELPEAARLETERGVSATMGDYRPIDGASRIAMPTATLGVALRGEGLTGYFDSPERTLDAQSATLLIEATTGGFVPHMAEVDVRSSNVLVIHPLAPLKQLTRYVVAIQNVEAAEGGLAPVPEGFRRVRDNQTKGSAALDALRQRYERDVFPVLERAQVERSGLQLAWDFTTGSDEFIERDMRDVRGLTLEWLARNSLEVVLDEVTETPFRDALRQVRGTFRAPDFLDGDVLNRGANGRVAIVGTRRVTFTAIVPKSLEKGTGISLGYGHGSFGTQEEILSDSPRQIANRTRAVLYSTDWTGMARADAMNVIGAIGSEPTRAFEFTERVPQGMANWMVLTRIVAGPLRDLAPFQNEEGKPLYAPEATRFIGISQGHILGGVLAAVHPELTHVALLSGGAGFSHMLSRSRPLSAFFFPLDIASAYDRRRFEATLQPYFDRIDGAFWAKRVLAESLDETVTRKVLLQTGLGDVEVPNIGAFLHARALGLPLLEPSPVPVFGLQSVNSPTSGSALAVYDLGVDLEEVYARPEPYHAENHVHEGLRRLEPALSQLVGFFGSESEIAHHCTGPCAPD